MGCDIHIITEIKENNKWKYVPEIPKSFDKRNYNLFAILAGVRDSWNSQIFEAKGLPNDISGKKFNFIRYRDEYKSVYETTETTCLVINNEIIGKLWNCQDERYKATKVKLTAEEYHKLKEFQEQDPAAYNSRFADLTKIISDSVEYYIRDASVVGGKWEKVLYKCIYPTIDEYLENNFSNEYDNTVKDYGYWKIDFDSPDFHTPSYITLKEFEEADYSTMYNQKAKIPKEFFDTFTNFSGSLPKQMIVEDSSIKDIRDALSEAIQPTVTISWKDNKINFNNTALYIGIQELKDIANKYNIEDHNNIRIVFAFDN